MTDRETIAVYNARAGDYSTHFASGDAPDATLAAFIARLNRGARVLDLGCGPGLSSAHMAAAGLDPDPVDAAEAMVAIARNTHGLPARLGTFDDLQGPYDAVWANFSLLHMPRADLPGFLVRLHEAMAPGGLLHLGLKSGQGEARDKIGRQYSYFTPDEIAAWLAAAGFTPDAPVLGEERGLAGDVEPFFTLTALRSD